MNVEFTNVAVLGAGTMGSGIAQICAQAGSQVALYDVEQKFLDRGRESIAKFLAKGIEKGKTTPAQRDAILGAIRPMLSLRDAARGAGLVIEAVPEDLALKRAVFTDVAAACAPATVLASNTSSLSLREVFAGVPAPERCCGMHFFNPPPLMPLLEVVRLETTSPATVERALRFAKQLGKEPIVVKDSPGFASSRLGVALGLEAIRMLAEGVASAADIDTAMRLGYGHPMGPLRLTDLVGLDVRLAIADYLKKTLGSAAFEAPPLMREMVKAGKLGKKAGRGFYDWQE